MNPRLLVLAFSAIGFFGMAGLAQEITMTPLGPAASEVYGRSEWSIGTGSTRYTNPFDPREVAVELTAAGPQGTVHRLPGFWFEGDGRAEFRVRWMPSLPGTWRLTTTVRDSAGERTSGETVVEVRPSDSPGFVRRAGTYFRTDAGKTARGLFLVGPNLAWANEQTPAQYERWFKSLADNGGNFARIWMSHPSRMTETAELGPGRYDAAALAFYDEVFALAERHGIYLMVCFNNHRDLLERDMWGEAIWPRFPYNAKNGGPATRPSDFPVHPESIRLYEQRLRYIAARYSAYTSVAFWEFFNEQNYSNVDISPEWTRRMSDYLRSMDPYARGITTSFGGQDQPEVWDLPTTEITQAHMYPGEAVGDGSRAVASGIRRLLRHGKPAYVAEIGMDHRFSDAKLDPDGIGTNMHNTAWAGLAAGGAGTAAMWWWDNYIDPKNLWHIYRGVSEFAQVTGVADPDKAYAPAEIDIARHAQSSGRTASDLVIKPSEGWGKSHGSDIVVAPDGGLSLPMPRFLMGLLKPDLRTPTALLLDLKAETQMTLQIGEVSDVGVLRVIADGKPLADFAFSALPGSPDLQSTAQRGAIHQGKVDVSRTVTLPAGTRRIELTNLGTDWITVERMTFAGARPADIADVDRLGLVSKTTGEAIVWLRDRASNWVADRDRKGQPPPPQTDLQIRLPVSGPGWTAHWFDTRQAKFVGTSPVAADGSVAVPSFTRDIAVWVKK
jgi:hypothetical protein